MREQGAKSHADNVMGKSRGIPVFRIFAVMFGKVTYIFLMMGVCFAGHGQQSEFLASGKVIDVRTRKGIKASIKYSSLPTGSISGRFNDSTFSFQIFGTARYKVTAVADGYNPKTVIVDPKDVDTDNRVLKDIQLIPNGETIVLDNLIFSQGKSAIHESSFKGLDEVVQMMKENGKMVIQLEGHTDSQGSAKANLALSEDRVQAVKTYLVKKGVSKDRIKTKAYGGTRPLRTEMSSDERELNRRVEMRILKN